MHTVKIGAGFNGVTLPGQQKLFNAGDTCALTDDQFKQISAHSLSVGVVIDLGGVPDSFAPSAVPTYAGVRSNRFDPVRSAYNLKGSNTRKLRASMGKALAGTGFSTHLTLGDSKMAGVGAGHDKNWPRVFQKQLALAGYPIGGWVSVLGYASNIGDPRVTLNGIVNSGNYIALNSSGDTATYTSQEPGVAIEIWFSRAGSPFSITVDGSIIATGVTVNGGTYNGTTGVVTPTAGNWGSLKITGLPSANHTVVCGWVSGTSYLGSIEVQAASGLRVVNYGISGASANSGATQAFPWPNAYTQLVAMPVPDVVWLSLGGNDNNLGRTPQQTYDDLVSIRTQFNAAWGSSPDWIMVGETEGFSTPIGDNWRNNFMPRLYDLADVWDCPLVDFENLEGTIATAIANGLNSGDGIHENPAGYAFLGAAAARAIL